MDGTTLTGRSRTDAALAEVKRLRAIEYPPRHELGSLSDGETSVINALVKAWNLFLNLPVDHPDAQTEFRFGIHSLQNMIFARPAIRSWNAGVCPVAAADTDAQKDRP